MVCYIYFFTANDLSILIASKLMESNGEMIGVATQDDFITAIETDILDTSRERGCFRGGVGEIFHVIHETVTCRCSLLNHVTSCMMYI